MTLKNTGTLFIISAPSGAGKTSLVKALLGSMSQICVSVSYTTRQQRQGEIDGKDYNFVSPDQFESMLGQSAFIEHACVFGNFYGTSEEWVKNRLQNGIDVILEIDWQGAQQVRHLIPEAVSIFILPPSRATLLERLLQRGQDNQKVIDQRMAEAVSEMSHYAEFDHLIINDDFQLALAELQAVISCQRTRIDRQEVIFQSLISELLS